MIPASFDYHAPKTLASDRPAVEVPGEAKVSRADRASAPAEAADGRHLVDINHVPGLEYIKEEEASSGLGRTESRSST